MSKQFKFLDWDIYQDAKNLYVNIHQTSKSFPKNQRFELTSQLIRAALSVSLNIAEGSGRSSDKELVRFLDISLGSLYETLACVDILRDQDLIEVNLYDKLVKEVASLANRIGGFRKSLVKSS